MFFLLSSNHNRDLSLTLLLLLLPITIGHVNIVKDFVTDFLRLKKMEVIVIY